MTLWQPYKPTAEAPWNWRRTVHLHRRTVFGATWKELQRDVADSPQAAVSRILNGACRLDGVPVDFTEIAELVSSSASQAETAERLRAAWIYRCLLSPDPLGERLTLMWHNHFATSNLKVGSMVAMKQQNDTLRQFSRSHFGNILKAMLHDPAMLVWLDADSNRNGHANENFARELMELFTLGIGNYTEDDVKDAARALTGISVTDGKFQFREPRHDSSLKTILGAKKNFDADELADHLLMQPATAARLAWRLTQEFFGEGVLGPEALAELSRQLQESRLNISAAIETILRSQLFFSDENIATRVCDPMTWLIAPLAAFELFDPPPVTMLLAEWLDRLGLDLFEPPNVGGWDGGRAWLNTRTLIARTNYAAAIFSGDLWRPARPLQITPLVAQHLPNGTATEFLAMIISGSDESTTAAALETSQSFVQLMTRPSAHLH